METNTQVRGSETGLRSDCPLLLSVATKRLFATNAFRILGLPVESSVREIARQGDKIKQMEQLGMGVHDVSKAFPLTPPPSLDQFREAIQRLKDPEKRLLDEFFWFWPQQFGQSGADPAIHALNAGDSQTAIEIWQIKEYDPADGLVAAHNLAVMWHMTALEFEGRVNDAGADSDAQSKLAAQWMNAFKRWQRIVADDRLWDRFNDRIRQINDVRITSGFTYRIRRSLPEALFKINGELALEYVEAGQPKLARIQGRYVRAAGSGWADAQKTAELVLAPLASRIKEHIRLAKVRATGAPTEGAAAANELATLAAGAAGAFEVVCGPDSRFRNELFDEVAEVCNKLIVAYLHKVSDPATALRVLTTVLPLATLEALKKQIGSNIVVLQQQLAARTNQNKQQSSQSTGRAAPASAKRGPTRSAEPNPPVFQRYSANNEKNFHPRQWANPQNRPPWLQPGFYSFSKSGLAARFILVGVITLGAILLRACTGEDPSSAPPVNMPPKSVGMTAPQNTPQTVPDSQAFGNTRIVFVPPANLKPAETVDGDADIGPAAVYSVPISRMGELTQEKHALEERLRNLRELRADLAGEKDRLMSLQSTFNGTGSGNPPADLSTDIQIYNQRIAQLNLKYVDYNRRVTEFNAKLEALADKETVTNSP